MTLIKQGIDVSFAKGLDTKTDSKRVAVGNFVSLENTVFEKGGLLQKRNGYAQLTSLPITAPAQYLTTFNNNLTAVGTSIEAYSASNQEWVQRGNIQPMSINTLPLLRNNFNQIKADSAVASNGLVCTVYLENNGSSSVNKYVIADSVTGQNIIEPSLIPVASGSVSGPRVFVLGVNFILMFTNTIAGTPHLQYVAISSLDPTIVGPNIEVGAGYVPASTISWDGFVVSDFLYVAYGTSTGVNVTYLISSSPNPVTPVTFTGNLATMMSVTVDNTTSSLTVYVSFIDGATGLGYTLAVYQSLGTKFPPVLITGGGTFLNIASAPQNGAVSVFVERSNAYSYDLTIPPAPTNFVYRIVVSSTGVLLSTVISIRSVGLASKAFVIPSSLNNPYALFTELPAPSSVGVGATAYVIENNTSYEFDGSAWVPTNVIYYLAAFQSQYQPTYFLINGSMSIQTAPVVAAKLAYENGGGYLTIGLPGVTVFKNVAWVAYLFKDLIQAVNKNTNVPAGTQVNGIYSQTGINLATFAISTQNLDTAEIGNDLHLSGGFLWMYDGYLPVEHNFFLFPDTDGTGQVVASVAAGAMTPQKYYYQFTYEWTDNNGNAFRSAPSIPVTTTLSGGQNTVTLHIPTLRLTYKTANPVKICIYRWSVGQENYYEVTSITTPLLNDTTVDSVTYIDLLSDASILGNALIYTTGGVVENTNAPASNLLSLFDTRLWLVDAEDKNLLWYSKQVIEHTPVEMSDLFTMYIAPTTAAQGSTGPITAIAPMDDKLIIFKQNAIYYINGTGPDNTGANGQYSQPIFITATVGCANQQSIVFMPQGLMFQSSKGIWLVDRGLNTSYIGAPVEKYNIGTVESAQNIPETNQVRFIMSTGITLMYDYFYGQWGTFTGVPALSSCLFQDMHTFINKYGQVYQESRGTYLDGSNPVLMQFTTGPIRLGDLQNYQRAYTFFLLGSYISPHKLYVGVAYDYEGAVSQTNLLEPKNYSTPYGSGPSQSPYGEGSPYGGPNSLEHFRVFLQRQRCMAFAISVQEIYDPTLGVIAGAGLTLSGINVVCGFKSKWSTISATKTYG